MNFTTPSLILEPPNLNMIGCCHICKHINIYNERCKKYNCTTFLYFICDSFEENSEYDRYLNRNNSC